jgi:hypothetical protein
MFSFAAVRVSCVIFVLNFRLSITQLVFESGPEVQNGGNGWVSETVIFVHLFLL